jgi:hypothetical protein
MGHRLATAIELVACATPSIRVSPHRATQVKVSLCT